MFYLVCIKYELELLEYLNTEIRMFSFLIIFILFYLCIIIVVFIVITFYSHFVLNAE